jgi:hypothetical protein
MWTLVLISIMFNASEGYDEPFVEAWYEYENMVECFQAREILGGQMTGASGYFPQGTQAICIYKGEKDGA